MKFMLLIWAVAILQGIAAGFDVIADERSAAQRRAMREDCRSKGL